ncbi:YgjV family protein [Azospirillum brasilense]|uniref:YgjV family protein n=1 Tax=Azospirillum brasilense TaxID=192 RepID=UPI001EDA3D83|nr:YgjV family protein [Azospirillum brasilense]UKJ74458.1 YgjV family protein [Azospirillum brasilense]
MTVLHLSDLAGGAGFALVALWPWLSGRRALLAGQGASAAAFALHYLLIGAGTGAALSGLSVLQVATAWPDDRPRWCRALYISTLPALAVLAASTWAGWPSACAAAGMALGTAARWCRSALLLRALFLLAGACWVAHDFLSGSTFGLAADLLCMAGLVYGALRDCVPRKRDEAALGQLLPTSQAPTPGPPSVEPR